ncbi:hypothetical protein CDAR_452151 [Caerostris darwini]|uniref:Uncharacterized protein n=1 Tax=Caerostris darwini TaxID=1538125 RepID=A0AAV4PTP1_9ARAC|nr:hypothetical protein CDAR_452151 [Caerostris darwini]
MNNGSAIEKDEKVLSFAPTKGTEKKKGTTKVRVAADLLLPIGMELHNFLNGLRVNLVAWMTIEMSDLLRCLSDYWMLLFSNWLITNNFVRDKRTSLVILVN